MLVEVLTRVAIVVGILLPVSLALFIGRERLERTIVELRPRLRICAPYLAVLGLVLILNRVMRQTAPNMGFHATELIRDIEGDFILIFQEISTPELTAYFSAIYVYGYAFLLIFPGVAYFAMSDTKTFRRLMAAYSLNYAIGVVLYILVIAYGPRNHTIFASELGVMLYEHSPQYQRLTREVNRSVNVFPSLHTSLSATVGIFAYYTRDSYPKWFVVATVIAVSVIISTMYLMIHWAVDVVAGLALAVVCVALANKIVGRWSYDDVRGRLTDLRRRLDR
ncbi:phosphatase PAP2 family protein [Natronolimnohabitans innermongolicus]|uniref:Phosphoesterase PA-phosphatase-like protein n=1 Tax=Natronolimnohabitans innermongolicus JCM 12255 TaxID=1227499 RepID=L9XKS0_9EURY|nr:phosphatase PAP2 family protein [Natronolimnohabitans innermongolicus]ELY61233.1 phosphoesterase PA-phosphatase-like protein [Natronolimnohabitans innermongolicus JCM 12255]